MNSVLGVMGPRRMGGVRGVTMRRSHLKVPLVISHSIVRNCGAVFPVPLKRTTAFGPRMMGRKTHMTTVRTSTSKVH